MRVILVGGGNTVYFLARQCISKGYKVTIINNQEEDSRYLAQQFSSVLVIQGDGSDPAILEEAGARHADVLMALTPNDQDNLIACQIARHMYDMPCTITLVNDPQNEELFRELGVTAVFAVSLLLVKLLEEQIGLAPIQTTD